MSLELINTLATSGTFVVIAAMAIAAIVQLRETRVVRTNPDGSFILTKSGGLFRQKPLVR
jgi:hypothetical protein